MISSQRGLPPSAITLPSAAVKDCKLQLPVLKSGVGVPSKVQKRNEGGGCLAETLLVVVYLYLQNHASPGDSTCCETVRLTTRHFLPLCFDKIAADT